MFISHYQVDCCGTWRLRASKLSQCAITFCLYRSYEKKCDFLCCARREFDEEFVQTLWKIMSTNGSISSPSKDSISTTGTGGSANGIDNLPRDLSRLSLFSTASSNNSQDEQFKCLGHAEHSLSCMQHYLQLGKLCDVVLIAGNNGKKVQAHR